MIYTDAKVYIDIRIKNLLKAFIHKQIGARTQQKNAGVILQNNTENWSSI